jgi:hypothetical protein
MSSKIVRRLAPVVLAVGALLAAPAVTAAASAPAVAATAQHAAPNDTWT